MSDVPNLRIRVLTNPGQVSDFWTWLTDPARKMVACDTETTGLDWWQPSFRTRLVQFGDVNGGWAIPFEGWPGLVAGALDWCSKARVPVVFHNVGYDAQALRAHGIELDWSNVEDTFVWAALGGYADENRQLKNLAQRAFGPWAGAGERVLKTGMSNAGWTWADVPVGWKPYPLYGVVDTCVTAGLWEVWDGQGRRKKWGADHALEMAVIRLTNEMSYRGLPTDGAYLWEQIQAHEAKEAEIKDALSVLGITNPAQDAQLELLLTQAGVPLPAKTDKGKTKLDGEVLQHIDHPAAKLVLQYRQVHRWLGTYLQPIFEGAGGTLDRGLLHPGIKSFEARTGRMSVENPPLQQLPADDPVVRRGIVARSDDEDFVSADYGQIELRLWACLNNDQPMLAALHQVDASGEDFFVNLGKTIYQDPGFTKKDPRRGLLKATVYTKLFGGGVDTAAGSAGVDVYSLVPTWKALEKAYPSLEDMGNSLITTEKDERGQTVHKATSPFGRVFQTLDPVNRRKLPNYVTQGTAAIALKKALVRLDAAGFGDLMVLPVHDEVCFSIPKADTKEAMHDIAEVMDSVIREEDGWGISVKAEPSAGPNWAEAK